MRVLIFGASVTQGFWDSEGGWASRIRKFYDLQKISGQYTNPPTFFNLGVSGDRSSDILNRFEAETKARIWPGEEFLFVFSVGTNNVREIDGKIESTPGEYKQDVITLLDRARVYSKKILMVGLPCCDEKFTIPVSWRNINYRNNNIQQIETTMQEVAIAEGTPFVPVFQKFTEQINSGEKLLSDGLHPNDAGHELIADLVRPELEKLIQ